MSGAVVIDASVWVARLVAIDAHHRRVAEWMTAHVAGGGQFVAPSLLLAEVGGAISRRTRIPAEGTRAIGVLRRFTALKIVAMENPFVERAAELAALLSLRGADCVYVALAERMHLPLLSLDAEHAQQRHLPPGRHEVRAPHKSGVPPLDNGQTAGAGLPRPVHPCAAFLSMAAGAMSSA